MSTGLDSGFDGMDEQTARRMVAVIQWVENQPTFHWDFDGDVEVQPGPHEVTFELKNVLEPDVDITEAAFLCDWDPSGNSGDGIWTATTDEITVVTPDTADWGIPGEQGRAVPWVSDNGLVYVITHNPGSPQYHGKLDGNLATSSSATCSIWTGETLADSTHNVTVYSPPLQAGQIDSGEWIRIQCFPEDGGRFRPVGATC